MINIKRVCKIKIVFIILAIIFSNNCFGMITTNSNKIIFNSCIYFENTKTLYVNDEGGEGVYTLIQEAINKAEDNYIIQVYSGYYPEAITIPSDLNNLKIIGKNYDLSGYSDEGYPIIDGSEKDDKNVVTIYGDNCNISNFIIINSDKNGMYIFESANSKVNYCNVSNSNINGIFIENSDNTIVNNVLINDSKENGILAENSDFCILKNNSIQDNGQPKLFNPFNGIGIWLRRSDQTQIVNCYIANNFFDGIFLYTSSNNEILNNEFIANGNEGVGLRLSNSQNEIIKNNKFQGNGICLNLESNDGWNSHIIEDNTVNSKHLLYYNNDEEITIDFDNIGQIILTNCNNIHIINTDISNVGYGIQIGFSNSISIENNYMNNILYNGIVIHRSSKINIENNVFEDSNNAKYIRLYESGSNNIANNTLNNFNIGICLDRSDINLIYNNILENTAVDSEKYTTGIKLDSSDDNRILKNNITKNLNSTILQYSENNTLTNNFFEFSEYGLFLEKSNNNIIYHNAFIYNNINAFDDGKNKWYNNSISEGNYWIDYIIKYPSIKNDGKIWNQPYFIPNNDNQDKYPLVRTTKNFPPHKPEKPIGNIVGKVGKPLIFKVSAIDPEGEKVLFQFDWGDSDPSGWIGDYETDEIAEIQHTWNERGVYEVKVRSKDEEGNIGLWSNPIELTLTKEKQFILQFNKIFIKLSEFRNLIE